MKYLLLLLLGIIFIGCKDVGKERPYEFITFSPSVSALDPSDGIHEVHMKRYLSESIEGMMLRNDALFGMQLLGKWIGNDSIVFNRIDSNTFTVDTIRSLRVESTGVHEWVADITSGLDYRWEQMSGPKLAGKDTKIKSVWTNGVQLAPKTSNLCSHQKDIGLVDFQMETSDSGSVIYLPTDRYRYIIYSKEDYDFAIDSSKIGDDWVVTISDKEWAIAQRIKGKWNLFAPEMAAEYIYRQLKHQSPSYWLAVDSSGNIIEFPIEKTGNLKLPHY